MKFLDETNVTTLFTFDSTYSDISSSAIILLNKESLTEIAEFETKEHRRYGQKSIIKRQTGLKNKKLHLKILLLGSARNTNLTTIRNAFSNNEFVYFDTEGYQSHLDGVYAPMSNFSQKKDEVEETITIDIDLIEKE